MNLSDLITHLRSVHSWGERAASALIALETNRTHLQSLDLFCLHPDCHSETKLSAKTAFSHTRTEFMRQHKEHPFIAIPKSHTTRGKPLAQVGQGVLLKALESLKFFTWRVEKFLFESHLQSGDDDQDLSTLTRRWYILRQSFLMGPSGDLESYLNQQLQPQVKEMLAIHEALFSRAPTILHHMYECICGLRFRQFSHLLIHRHQRPRCSQSIHGICVLLQPPGNVETESTEVTNDRNAINSIVWLISVEIAYIGTEAGQAKHLLKLAADMFTRDHSHDIMRKLINVLHDLRGNSHVSNSLSRFQSIATSTSPSPLPTSGKLLITWQRLQNVEMHFVPYPDHVRHRRYPCILCHDSQVHAHSWQSAEHLRHHIHAVHDHNKALDIIWKNVGDDALAVIEPMMPTRETLYISWEALIINWTSIFSRQLTLLSQDSFSFTDRIEMDAIRSRCSEDYYLDMFRGFSAHHALKNLADDWHFSEQHSHVMRIHHRKYLAMVKMVPSDIFCNSPRPPLRIGGKSAT